MASNLTNNQNIMPGVLGNNAILQQPHHQQLLNSHAAAPVQSTDMEPMNIEPVGMIHHSTASNTSPSPVLSMGNLQSMMGNTTTTSSVQSPLAAVLQVATSSPSSVLSSKPSSVMANDTYPQVLTRPRLQDLVREVDPTEQLDEDVEEVLLLIADDFVESTVEAACLLAKHRKAPTIEIKDVHLYLERHWCMWIPGFGTDELRPYKRAPITEAHKQRLALIRKALKKY